MTIQQMGRTMAENIVRRAFRGMRQDPKRTIRNLVDLGLETSGGDLHRRFMEAAQKILRREDSPYYDMVLRTVQQVDEERLLTFGLNLGWESLTAGAARIRELEQERGHNIPWSLTLHIASSGSMTSGGYLRLVLEGMELGIYSYFLMPADDVSVETALNVTAASRNCALILFLPAGYDVKRNLTALSMHPNVLLCLDCGGPEWEKQADLLRDSRLLYGLHRRYATEGEIQDIVSGQWMERVLPHAGLAVFCIPQGDAFNHGTQHPVYRYAMDSRLEQRYPAIVFDFYPDNLYMDVLISGDSCFMGVLPDGVITEFRSGQEQPAAGNALSTPLDTLLRHFPKADSNASLQRHGT